MKMALAVLGDPIAHSLSPVMHEAAFAHLEMDAGYLPLRVEKENLPEALEGLKALNFTGVNVTIPHKVAVMELLDEVDERARKIGAVNTIRQEGGRLYGTNTDGEGWYRSLVQDYGKEPRGEDVLLIGAGGAARAAAHTLREKGCGRLVIANRTPEKAALLAEETNAEVMTLEEAASSLDQFQLLVQSTAAGMSPGIDVRPIDTTGLHPGIFVSDMIYNPWKTALLQDAEKAGCRFQNGLGMFVHQGAAAFEFWFGRTAPAEIMENAVKNALRT
ncbi:shikimate dehydrogenase [Alkalicoccus urumqiensis]|uniref:Shikimate dehydrogenase (NADP(+)) n=1 Tax=Alkalicoccus urumqiensis TaxID=1548213 RepID=A0A2P6MFL2_ALKUR|nr:shikimate dehydrogenase [Alkalicoccus urumqiensis]PRO65076.1 shikimate dehydrogenase [Alkalicoccus urumqiensis]